MGWVPGQPTPTCVATMLLGASGSDHWPGPLGVGTGVSGHGVLSLRVSGPAEGLGGGAAPAGGLGRH